MNGPLRSPNSLPKAQLMNGPGSPSSSMGTYMSSRHQMVPAYMPGGPVGAPLSHLPMGMLAPGPYQPPGGMGALAIPAFVQVLLCQTSSTAPSHLPHKLAICLRTSYGCRLWPMQMPPPSQQTDYKANGTSSTPDKCCCRPSHAPWAAGHEHGDGHGARAWHGCTRHCDTVAVPAVWQFCTAAHVQSLVLRLSTTAPEFCKNHAACHGPALHPWCQQAGARHALPSGTAKRQWAAGAPACAPACRRRQPAAAVGQLICTATGVDQPA